MFFPKACNSKNKNRSFDVDDARISKDISCLQAFNLCWRKTWRGLHETLPQACNGLWICQDQQYQQCLSKTQRPRHKSGDRQGFHPDISPIFRGYLWVIIPNSSLERSGEVQNYDFLSPLNPPALSFNNRRACCQCCCQMVWQAATSPRIKACISRRCPNCAFSKSPPEIRISISFSHRRP